MKTKIAFLGPPGSGKGTQAKLLAQRLGAEHISSGDIIRENIRENTTLGAAFAEALKRGELGPTHLVTEMMRERLTSLMGAGRGYILDGFPRTREQAEMLVEMDAVDRVIFLDVNGNVIGSRVSGRLSCACGRSYHIKDNPPKREGACDGCGSSLFVRTDDMEEKIRVRIAEYERETAPLIEFFSERKILTRLDGTLPIEKLADEIARSLK